MQDDHAADDDSAPHYRFTDGDVPNGVLSTAFSTTFSTTFSQRRSLDWFSTMFPRRRSLNVLDDDGDILNHNNRVRVHPTVNDGLTARGAIVIGMAGVEVCGSF
jgi:hypothetical protein